MKYMEDIVEKAGFSDILAKVKAGDRLTEEDGLRLYESPELLAVGYLANTVRERLNGNYAYFNYNQHINYSNICINLCKFCAFGRDKSSREAYQMSPEEVRFKVMERLSEPITEIHMVGGIHPDLEFDYYLDILRAIKEVRPEVHIKAFTCVEIAHLATLAGKSVEETLKMLMEAGLDSLPGGGAEVFSPRIRKKTCEKKLSGEGWLEVARTAHSLGLKSNATMLYGHIETAEEKIEHLAALREVQDESGGFQTFIPLSFHPRNTAMAYLSQSTGINDLKNIAISRIFLDNFPHIKAYWIMVGSKLAQVALSFGADDIDGTVTEEKVTHMAGAETEQAMALEELVRLIREADRIPVQRDTLYQEIERY